MGPDLQDQQLYIVECHLHRTKSSDYGKQLHLGGER